MVMLPRKKPPGMRKPAPPPAPPSPGSTQQAASAAIAAYQQRKPTQPARHTGMTEWAKGEMARVRAGWDEQTKERGRDERDTDLHWFEEQSKRGGVRDRSNDESDLRKLVLRGLVLSSEPEEEVEAPALVYRDEWERSYDDDDVVLRDHRLCDVSAPPPRWRRLLSWLRGTAA